MPTNNGNNNEESSYNCYNDNDDGGNNNDIKEDLSAQHSSSKQENEKVGKPQASAIYAENVQEKIPANDDNNDSGGSSSNKEAEVGGEPETKNLATTTKTTTTTKTRSNEAYAERVARKMQSISSKDRNNKSGFNDSNHDVADNSKSSYANRLADKIDDSDGEDDYESVPEMYYDSESSARRQLHIDVDKNGDDQEDDQQQQPGSYQQEGRAVGGLPVWARPANRLRETIRSSMTRLSNNQQRQSQANQRSMGDTSVVAYAVEEPEVFEATEIDNAEQDEKIKKYKILVCLSVCIVIIVIAATVPLAVRREKDAPLRSYVDITILLKLDFHPEETSWSLKCDGDDNPVASIIQGKYNSTFDQQIVETITGKLSEGDECTFTLHDKGGNGIDDGYYRIYHGSNTDNSAKLLASGNGTFVSETAHDITITPPLEDINNDNATNITIAIQLDGNPMETGWKLDCDSFQRTLQGKPGLYSGGYERHFLTLIVPVYREDNCSIAVYYTTNSTIHDGNYYVFYGSDSANLAAMLVDDKISFYIEAGKHFTVASPYVKWERAGQDIYGQYAYDNFGFSVLLASSADVMIVGATAFLDGGQSGSCKVYKLDASIGVWKKIGQTLKVNRTNAYTNDDYGMSTSISDDGTVVAVGAPLDNNGKGGAYVYDYNESTNKWDLVEIFQGDNETDHLGSYVQLNGNGSSVAVGSRQQSDYPVFKAYGNGSVSVYERSTGSGGWDQVGKAVNGLSFGDGFGEVLALSHNGHVLAVGSLGNYAKVFRYNETTDDWDDFGVNSTLRGDKEVGEGDKFGWGISLSRNGEILAVAAPRHYGINGTKHRTGMAKVFKFNSNFNGWSQYGNSIYGENKLDSMGAFSGISLSDDGMTLAIGSHGALKKDEVKSGNTRIYDYNVETDRWIQSSQDIDGEASGDASGFAVSLNGNGNLVAIGAYTNNGVNGNIIDSGLVRVYRRGE